METLAMARETLAAAAPETLNRIGLALTAARTGKGPGSEHGSSPPKPG
jgi:hypothetical protein